MSSRHTQVIDVSILIVHTYEGDVLRQTLRGLRRAAPTVACEVLVIDNNPGAGMGDILKEEFPWVRHLPQEENRGFGASMNRGIQASTGRYVLIFNPDIVVQPGALEELTRFMDENGNVGVCGPKLLNPDGTLQYSCYRQPTLMLPVYRRTPLGKSERGKIAVDRYLMCDADHKETMHVDSLIGAALFARRESLEKVGLFDERFFMYYEDSDLCRRFWEGGFPVMYHPTACMVHYHGRASAQGGLFQQLTSRFTWIHIHSFIKYWRKYRGRENPRLTYGRSPKPIVSHGGPVPDSEHQHGF